MNRLSRHVICLGMFGVVSSGCSEKAPERARQAEPQKTATAATSAAPTPEPARRPPDDAPSTRIDTSAWETKKLSELGKEPFGFAGVLQVPPGTKTTSARTSAGPLAYLDLPSGARMMLMERAPNASDDPSAVEQVLKLTGKVILKKREKTWFMLAIERDDGIAITGASWGVRPGLDCGTEQPITRPQVEEAIAICSSLKAK
jgi:hypothetical protein